MGTGMARRIAGAGLDLRVWNRSPGSAHALADVATVELDAAKAVQGADVVVTMVWDADSVADVVDRKSTRLNSSHMSISYAVFCLKKKKNRYTNLLVRHKERRWHHRDRQDEQSGDIMQLV